MKVLERFIKNEASLYKELESEQWKKKHNEAMRVYELEDIYDEILNFTKSLIHYDEKHNFRSTKIANYPYNSEQEELNKAFKVSLNLVEQSLTFFKNENKRINFKKYSSCKIDIKLLEDIRELCKAYLGNDDTWLESNKMQKILKKAQREFELGEIEPL